MIVLSWKGGSVAGAFRHSVTVPTNDPENPDISLTVQGQIVP